MGQSKMFWWAFGLLCGAGVLSVLNPCVGVFFLFYLIIALVTLGGYLLMRSRVQALSNGSLTDDARDEAQRSVNFLSHGLFGFCSIFTVFAAVGTCVLTMLGIDPANGGTVLFPVQLAPFERALDLWAASAVMSVIAAILLMRAGKDVRLWLRRTC